MTHEQRPPADARTAVGFQRFWAREFQGGGGPATRAFSQRLGACLAWLGQGIGLAPNHLTLLSLTASLTAALCYATLPAGWAGAGVCLLLYQLAYGFDCADGQLARASGRTSEFGAWLDITIDTLTVLALSFALLYWLTAHPTQYSGLSFLCVAVLSAGRTLCLYGSHTVGDSAHARSHRPLALASVPKKALWLIFDTPVFVTLICLLRDKSLALQFYALFIGVIDLARAGYLGLRLPQA